MSPIHQYQLSHAPISRSADAAVLTVLFFKSYIWLDHKLTDYVRPLTPFKPLLVMSFIDYAPCRLILQILLQKNCPFLTTYIDSLYISSSWRVQIFVGSFTINKRSVWFFVIDTDSFVMFSTEEYDWEQLVFTLSSICWAELKICYQKNDLQKLTEN